MRYKVRRADLDDPDDVEHLRSLHKITFDDGSPMPELTYGAWWLLHPEDHEDSPVGFCGVVPSTYYAPYAYLKRVGVLKAHRGQGLQRRMIRIREQWAKRHGFECVVTETTNSNPASANSLIAQGYRVFWPDPQWSFPNSVYFRKRLQAL